VALREGEALSAGERITTARGARASLRLDKATTLGLLDATSVTLADEDGRGILEVDRGTFLLERDAMSAGTGDGAAAELGDEGEGAQVERPIAIRVAAAVLEAAQGAPVTAAVRTNEKGDAVLTVRRGKLLVRSGAGDEVTVAAGETARLAPGAAVDKRAVWSGVEAPVEHIGDAAGEREQVVSSAPRGLGTLTARAPGTTDVVSGVRLVSHKVQVVVRDGFARTEIEEEFFNETPRVLEGRYVFPLPPDASISRLALWVGSELMEGEIEERKRAAAIFNGIVEDTVRPRDPALLEWVSGAEFSLKIFPIPPKSSRKVVLAYNQALPAAGGRVRYVYPLSLGSDRTTTIDDFSMSVSVSEAEAAPADVVTRGLPATIRMEDRKLLAQYSARSFTPAEDFVIGYSVGREGGAFAGGGAKVALYTPREGEFSMGRPARGPERRAVASDTKTIPAVFGGGLEGDAAIKSGFVAVRMTADLPDDAPTPSHIRRDVAVVVDTSHSQSRETLESQVRLAVALIGQMDPDERFVVLACDSACSTYPEAGLAEVTLKEVEAAGRWLSQKTPAGASDVAGALVDAARRLPASGSGQLIYIGDGAASAGELSADSIAARVKPVMAAQKVDLRLLGAGRTVDEVVLAGLAQRVGATYEPVKTGESLSERVSAIAMGLRAPVIRDVAIELPTSLRDVYPRALPNLRLGQEVLLVARSVGDVSGAIGLRGELGGAPYSRSKTIKMEGKTTESQNPLVPRLWAEARVRELEASSEKDAAAEAILLSKRFHVMSRHTALLVLENERMFAEFGIRRTTRKAGDQSDHAFAQEADEHSSEGTSSGIGNSFGRSGLAAPSPEASPEAPAADGKSSEESPKSMWGAPSFDPGSGGLGLTGKGEGGGGRGEGIGLGSVGTIGRGAGTGTGQGFGSGHGRLGGSHKTSPPQVRMGATSVSGRLPPEVVQRIVRQNFGRFRLCYESGLRNSPNLAGRVSVRFLIGMDGAVSAVGNAGSDIADNSVVSCVVRSFWGLRFPAPEGGVVTVVYPITFSPGDSSSSSWSSPAASSPWRPQGFAPFTPAAPSAVHRPETGAFASEGEPALAALRKAADEAPASRRKQESLVRGLLARGRFYEALVRARSFAALDPDRPQAQELVAYAAAANSDGGLALQAIDALVEVAPRKVSPHARAARAFEAAGDERRACAHWRSVAELSPGSASALYEALRCRARVLDGREEVLREARGYASPAASITALIAQLDEGKMPRYEPSGAGGPAFEARVTCTSPSSACPSVVVVAPSGTVYSPWTPASPLAPPARGGLSAVAISKVGDGTYRTFLVGGDAGAEGELELRALGSVKKLAITRGGARTVAATVISGVETSFGGFGG
jgi:Ca-activated chloride channel family protein